MLSCQTGNHVCYPVHLKTNSTKWIKATRKARSEDICIAEKKKQGGGDISAAAIWIEAFRRKGKTHSTKNRPILYFMTTFKAPFLCNKAERLSWTSVWTLYGKGVFGTSMLCVCL